MGNVCITLHIFVKGIILRLLEHQILRLPMLMVKARIFSNQVSLIDHSCIVEMLLRPIRRIFEVDRKGSVDEPSRGFSIIHLSFSVLV